jgi:PhzF family phenazine biosynthesis protein
MALPLWQVDAFTSAAFAGNPAAVCLLPAMRDDVWLQAVAREMNLSETAFLVQRAGGDLDLRWFTPTVEVDLCGHATLASAHVLWEEGLLPASATARFHTRSGLLTATREGSAIELDFPVKGREPLEGAPDLAPALGAPVLDLQRNRFDYLARLESEEAVRRLSPDLAALHRLPVRGIIVTSRADREGAGYDFVSRFFGPGAGVDEDPVTGSAHCFLAPYWAAELGRSELVGYQASARGGTVRVRLLGDRVKLGGQAVTVLKGELLV